MGPKAIHAFLLCRHVLVDTDDSAGIVTANLDKILVVKLVYACRPDYRPCLVECICELFLMTANMRQVGAEHGCWLNDCT